MMSNKSNVILSADTAQYTDKINKVIQLNKQLETSFNGISKSLEPLNSFFDTLNTKVKKFNDEANTIGNNIRKNNGMKQPRGGKNASPLDNVDKLNSDISSMFKNKVATFIGANVSNITGTRAFGSTVGSLAGKLMNMKSSASAAGGATGGLNMTVVAATAKLTLLLGVMYGLYKIGESGYKTALDVSRAYKQLGDEANNAFQYAKKLNDELGTPLSKTLTQMAKTTSALKQTGFSGSQPEKMAEGLETLSTKAGLMYGEDPSDVYGKAQNAVLSGSDDLAEYGANVTDEVMAGWLSATKGINMYAVKISDAQMQTYRYEKIMQDLGYISNYSGDLTNTAFAKQLQMMNELESMGQKLKAMFMPLFESIVSGLNEIVNKAYDAFVKLGIIKASDLTSTADTVAANTAATGAVDKQNGAYRKLGEQIKAATQAKLAFDEYTSFTAVDQLNDNADLGGTGSSDSITNKGANSGLSNLSDSVKKTLDDIKSGKNKAEILAEMELMNPDDLKTLWGNMSWVDKGMYGTQIAMKFMQDGDISTGLQALLYGSVGSFTGINAINDFVSGDPLGGLVEASQTVLFWFGGWKGKLASAAGELTEFTWGPSSLAGIMTVVSEISVMLGGWAGLIVAAGIALIPVAAQLGQTINKSITKANPNWLGGATDSRMAANMKYGKGTDEAKAYYYELMKQKGVSENDIPTYANGGYVPSEQLAHMDSGDLVFNLNSSATKPALKTMADSLADAGASNGNGNTTVLENHFHFSDVVGLSHEAVKEMMEEGSDYLAQILKDKGAFNYGSV